jgi:hypothetical protein
MSWVYYSDPERETGPEDVATIPRHPGRRAPLRLERRSPATESEGREQLILPGFAPLLKSVLDVESDQALATGMLSSDLHEGRCSNWAETYSRRI